MGKDDDELELDPLETDFDYNYEEVCLLDE